MLNASLNIDFGGSTLAPGIALDLKREIWRDTRGNTRGGLRMAYIEVPTATHTGYLSPCGFDDVTSANCPFMAETLMAL